MLKESNGVPRGGDIEPDHMGAVLGSRTIGMGTGRVVIGLLGRRELNTADHMAKSLEAEDVCLGRLTTVVDGERIA